MFGNVRGGNYGSVGQQINKQNQTLNQINMETSPDYGKIAEESIKGRSRERRAAIEAEAKIHRVGLDAMGTKKVYEIDAETEKAVADIKRPAKRFAGIVGAAGEIAGGFVLKKFNDEAKEREAKWEKRFEERMRLTEEALSRPYPKPPAIEKPPMQEKPTYGTLQSGDSSTPGGGQQTYSQMTGGPSVPAGGGYVKPQEMYTYLTTHHKLSHNKAIGLIANAQRESSFKLNNPGDGGFSNGLFQWHKGRLSAMQKAVPDWQTNWKGQIDYALSEPGESGNNYLNTTFSTPNAAAAHWTRYWERPAHPDQDIQKQDAFISTYSFS